MDTHEQVRARRKREIYAKYKHQYVSETYLRERILEAITVDETFVVVFNERPNPRVCVGDLISLFEDGIDGETSLRAILRERLDEAYVISVFQPVYSYASIQSVVNVQVTLSWTRHHVTTAATHDDGPL